MPTIVLARARSRRKASSPGPSSPRSSTSGCPQPASGRLGREILDRLADYSRQMNTWVGVDPAVLTRHRSFSIRPMPSCWSYAASGSQTFRALRASTTSRARSGSRETGRSRGSRNWPGIDPGCEVRWGREVPLVRRVRRRPRAITCGLEQRGRVAPMRASTMRASTPSPCGARARRAGIVTTPPLSICPRGFAGVQSDRLDEDGSRAGSQVLRAALSASATGSLALGRSDTWGRQSTRKRLDLVQPRSHPAREHRTSSTFAATSTDRRAAMPSPWFDRPARDRVGALAAPDAADGRPLPE